MVDQLKFRRQGLSFSVKFDGAFSAWISGRQPSTGLKTSGLEKGLLLARDGREVAEGGMGFGVPVVRYFDRMYFSKGADLALASTSLRKVFHIDSIEEVRAGGHVVSMGAGGLARLYRSSRSLRKPIIKVGEMANRLAPARTEFKTMPSRGSISVRYEAFPGRIRVSCDMTKLDRRGCQGIFMLNEQGPSFLRKYKDSSGRSLIDEGIGAWERVMAGEASLSDIASTFSFSLRKADGAEMWRGRETHGDVAWAGLIYEIPPEISAFVYNIFMRYGGI